MNKTYPPRPLNGTGNRIDSVAGVDVSASAASGIRYARNRRDWRLGGLPPGSD